MVEGGCDSCGMLTCNDEEVYSANRNKLICRKCYENFYSLEALREIKLKKLLKGNIFQKILDLVKK